MFEHIAKERRQKIKPDNPDDLKESIHAALDELKAYSALQTICIQSSEPIYALVDEIADSALRLRELGHEVPTLNLVGIDPQFIGCFAINEVTAPIAEKMEQMEQQAELKAALLEKWGPRRQENTTPKLPPVPKRE